MKKNKFWISYLVLIIGYIYSFFIELVVYIYVVEQEWLRYDRYSPCILYAQMFNALPVVLVGLIVYSDSKKYGLNKDILAGTIVYIVLHVYGVLSMYFEIF